MSRSKFDTDLIGLQAFMVFPINRENASESLKLNAHGICANTHYIQLYIIYIYIYLALFPFVRAEVLPATSSPPHLIVFSTVICLFSSSSILPALLPSSQLS